MARSALSFVFVWLTLLLSARASAEEAPRVVLLQIDDCPGGTLRVADAYQAARLELEQAGVTTVQSEAVGTQPEADLTASLRCGPGVEATLKLRFRNGTTSATRVVSLNDANPKDRPRLLGLALAELVRSDGRALVEPAVAVDAAAAKSVTAPPPVAAPPVVAPAAASSKAPTPTAHEASADERQPPDTAPDSSRVAFSADVIARWFTTYPGLTWGGALGLERGRFAVGLEGAVGRHVMAQGTADYGFGAVTLGAYVLRFVSSTGRLTLGPKLALGGTWATGESNHAEVVASGTGGLYADARVEAGAAVRLGSVELGARLNGGRATGLSVKDDGAVIGATGGWFLGGALGARF